MIAVDILHGLVSLLLLLAILRYAQTKITSESTTGKALAWILH